MTRRKPQYWLKGDPDLTIWPQRPLDEWAPRDVEKMLDNLFESILRRLQLVPLDLNRLDLLWRDSKLRRER